MERKCADSGMQLDIDELVLDYLLFSAIKEVINEYESQAKMSDDTYIESKTDNLLHLVDTFLIMFTTSHVGKHRNPQSIFRLQLLKFMVLLIKRTAPKETSASASALRVLRQRRQEQASSFRSSDKTLERLDLLDLTQHLGPRNRSESKVSHHETTSFQPTYRSSPPLISLLDTLPLFMALSASQIAMQETTITETWMQLAAGYMAQAVIEQYLVYGSQSPEVVQESFAWGFDAECVAEEGTEEWQINAMFWDEDRAVPGWDAIRDEHIHALTPPDGVHLQGHFRTLIADALSIVKFEEHIMEFLTKVHESQPQPLLAQVESGKVDGLSPRRVRVLQKMIGMA